MESGWIVRVVLNSPCTWRSGHYVFTAVLPDSDGSVPRIDFHDIGAAMCNVYSGK